MVREGKVKESKDGFIYAKDTVGITVVRNGNLEAKAMRWDLIPSAFMQREGLTLPEVIKAKNSRAKGSKGFSSYNARIETVQSLWAFKPSWKAGRRGIIPVDTWKERPNMDGAPPEFKGREYEVSVEQPHFLAALYDTWVGRDGTSLDSCTVITGPSDDIPPLQGIYHERTPILLNEDTAKVWLDPATTLDIAYEILKGAPVPAMIVTEIPKKPKI